MTFRRSLLFVILCSFLLTGISAAQAFLFVSPNTREHMTNEFAWESLDSFEQSNFLAVADYLTTRLCVKPQVHTAEGMDGNDTENSSLITGCSSSKARYVGELLGRYAHQKWILVFDPDPSSSERLLIATFSNDHPADVAKELRQAGINVGTIVPLEKTVQFYLWRKNASQDAEVRAYVESHHGALEEIAGKATFIGSDHRSQAQSIFDQRIRAYEQAHHQSFSTMLWTKQLHDLVRQPAGKVAP